MANLSNTTYRDLHNQVYQLAELTIEERELISLAKDYIANSPDWGVYTNYWMPKAEKLLRKQSLSKREMIQAPLWKILQDLGGRLQIAQHLAVAPDYRDELAALLKDRFRTRREFCELTGIAEDLLSHVLAHRKHLAIDTLTAALSKIGYTIQIVPQANAN